MIVVKLGGSLCHTVELKRWLITLSDYAKQQAIIIVPGGGPFADQVRTTQQYHHFDDSHAHHMAILAMAQFGLLIAGICTECQLFQLPAKQKNNTTGLSVWLPDQSLLSQKELKHNWDISSDSLALWLASKLNAEQLILIKHLDGSASTSITELINLNILDAGFKSLFSHKSINSQILSATEPSLFIEKRLSNTDFKLSLP